RREPRLMKKANRCQTFLELRAWQFDHRQILADAPFGEDAACSLGCGGGRGGAVAQRRRFVGEYDLRLVDVAALKFFQPRDLGEGQLGEELEEASGIGVFGVAPELPVVVRREALRV